jgi:hypothetical protein
MIPFGLLDQRATVHHFDSVRGPKGFPTRTEVGTDNYPCRLDHRSTVEDQIRQDIVTSLKLLILPSGALIEADDEVTVDGRRYHVEGHPDRMRAFGTEHHVEVTLRSVVEV